MAEVKILKEEKKNPFSQKLNRVSVGTNVEVVTDNQEVGSEELPPLFPARAWNATIMGTISWGDTPQEKDIIHLATDCTIGTALGYQIVCKWNGAEYYASQLVSIIAPPASGKSKAIMPTYMGKALDDRLRQQSEADLKLYEAALTAAKQQAKKGHNVPMLTPPRLKMFFAAADNTNAGLIDNCIDNDGNVMMVKSEIEEGVTSIGRDSAVGSVFWRDRYDQKELYRNRKTDKENRKCDRTAVGLLQTGTPGQLLTIVTSGENGLFSRFIWYHMPSARGVFNMKFADEEGGITAKDYFVNEGQKLLVALDALKNHIPDGLELRLTRAQEQKEYTLYSRLFANAQSAQEVTMVGVALRLPVNIRRMMMVEAFLDIEAVCKIMSGELRELTRNELLASPQLSAPTRSTKKRMVLHICDQTFENVLSLAEPLYRHAAYMLKYLDKAEVPRRRPSSSSEKLLNALPLKFTTQQAIAIGKRMGIPESTVHTVLGRLVKSCYLDNPKRSCYEFASGKKQVKV